MGLTWTGWQCRTGTEVVSGGTGEAGARQTLLNQGLRAVPLYRDTPRDHGR